MPGDSPKGTNEIAPTDNPAGPDGGFGSGEAKAFEDGVSELLKSLGFEVKGVSHTPFFPSEPSLFE